MKDIRQIKLINQKLEQQKFNYQIDLTKTNKLIEKKTISHNRMLSYRNDYINSEKLQITRIMPNLNININLFIKKINNVIYITEVEIDKLKEEKKIIEDKLAEVDKKIDLMSMFENNIKKIIKIQQEQSEQSALDDMVANDDFRREHE